MSQGRRAAAAAMGCLLLARGLVSAQTCGDCDGLNNGLSILDALVAAQAGAGLSPPLPLTPDQQIACDVDSDLAVTVLDALLMAQAAASLPVTLSCPGPAGGVKVYVNVGTAVEVVDIVTGLSVGTIPLSGAGQGVALEDNGDHLYATDGDTVLEIDTATDTATGRAVTLPGGNARQIAVAGGIAHVARFDAVSSVPLERIDLGPFSLLSGVAILFGAWECVSDLPGNNVYVGHIGLADQVTRVDVATGTAPATTASVGDNPIGLASNPVSGDLYVGARNTAGVADLFVVDGTTLGPVNTVDVDTAFGLAVTPTGDFLYVSQNDQVGVPSPPYYLSRVDTATLAITPQIGPVGSQPNYMAITPDGTTLFVCDGASATLTRLDLATNTVSGTVTLTDNPRDCVIK